MPYGRAWIPPPLLFSWISSLAHKLLKLLRTASRFHVETMTSSLPCGRASDWPEDCRPLWPVVFIQRLCGRVWQAPWCLEISTLSIYFLFSCANSEKLERDLLDSWHFAVDVMGESVVEPAGKTRPTVGGWKSVVKQRTFDIQSLRHPFLTLLLVVLLI